MSITIKERDKQVLRRVRRLVQTDCFNYPQGKQSRAHLKQRRYRERKRLL